MLWDPCDAEQQELVTDSIEVKVVTSAGFQVRNIEFLRRDVIEVPHAGGGSKPTVTWDYVVASVRMHEPNLARLVAWFWVHAWANNYFEQACKEVPDQVRSDLLAHTGEDLFRPPANIKKKVPSAAQTAPVPRYSPDLNITGMLLENVLTFATIEFQVIAGMLKPLALKLNRVPKLHAPTLEFVPLVQAVREEYLAAEGLRRRTTLSVPERSPAMRLVALERHGRTCQVCQFNMAGTYGEEYSHLIQVHHLIPIGRGERATDPRKDLVPVCPNCHAVLHSTDPPLSIEEARKLVRPRG